MNSRQAINLLKGLEQSLDDYCELNDEGKAAFRMAITALELFGNAEQLPSAQPDVPDTNVGDMISREDAIKEICEDIEWLESQGCTEIPLAERKERDVDIIKNLPSVQPKHGKWIWNGDTLDWERLHYCSECKKYALRDTDGKYEVLSDFCPHCGADMRGERDG